MGKIRLMDIRMLRILRLRGCLFYGMLVRDLSDSHNAGQFISIQPAEQEAIYGDILPVSKQQWPDRERLSMRYDSFLNAV